MFAYFHSEGNELRFACHFNYCRWNTGNLKKNGENGYLPGDKEAMYQAIKQLKNNHDMCVNMGKKSKEKVEEHQPKYVEKQFSDIYAQFLGEGKSDDVIRARFHTPFFQHYRTAC